MKKRVSFATVIIQMKIKLLALLFPFLCWSQIPAYYATIDFSQTGDNLKNQLTSLITNTHTTILPYTASSTTDTWDALYQTDLNPNNTNNVLLVYGWNDTDSEITNDLSRDKTFSCHTSSCSGLWVREHIYPRSLGTPAPARCPSGDRTAAYLPGRSLALARRAQAPQVVAADGHRRRRCDRTACVRAGR